MSFDPSQKLKGVQTLTPEEQINADTMKALKESKKTNIRQPCTGGSSEGTGVTPGVPDEFTIVPATSSEGTEEDDDETIEWVDTDKDEEKKDDDDDKSIDLELTDDEETDDEFMHSKEQVQDDDEEMDDELVHGDEQIDAGKNEEVKDDAKKAKLPPTSSSLTFSILASIPETPLVAPETTLIPPLSVSTIPPVLLQLRVAKLEKNVSELKKTDHSAEALATLKSQPAPKPSKIQTSTIDLKQEYEKSALEIHKIKKEQAEKQNMLKYTIKSTDKETLKENPANHTLYHALMEALIEDENAMNKGVFDTVKNHKRQHDDDEDPSAGPNQGKKTKRRRTKESESSMKPSTTKETSKGNAPSKSSKTGKSVTAHEPIEEPIAEVVMDDLETTTNEDVVNDANLPQDNVAPKTDKSSRDTSFKQPLRPPTLDPEWNKHQVVTDQPEQPWFNKMVSAAKDPLTFDELIATPIDFSKYVINRLQIDNLTQEILVGPVYNLLKGTCTSSIELEYNMEECFKTLTNRLDWNDLEGDRCPFNLTKPLPLKGHPGHLTVAAEYFFNNDLEFLKSSDPKNKYTTSITKTKVARYEIVGIEDMVPTLWSTTKVGYEKDVEKGIKHWGERQEITMRRADRQVYKFKEGDFVDLYLNDIEDMLLLAVQHKLFQLDDRDIVDLIVALCMFTRKLYTLSYKPPGVIYEDLNKQKRVMRADELYKFSDRTLKTVRDELHHIILDFCLGYNEEMSRRKWTAIDNRRSELMVELIDK
ncbi:hypothetical protein Tco_0476210 [Tanacetum coccineum]